MRIRVGGLFVDHPAAANERAGECQDGRYKSQKSPKSLGKPAEHSKMQLGEPQQALVGKMVSGIKEVQTVKKLWERKIDSGDSPHQNTI